MTSRLGKRKARRAVEEKNLSPEEIAPGVGSTSSISERDFQEITSKVENVLSKKIKETNDSQREIMKMLSEMKSQIAGPVNVGPHDEVVGENFENLPSFSGNQANRSFGSEINQDLIVNTTAEGCNMVTGASTPTPQAPHVINQQQPATHPGDYIQKLVDTVHSMAQQHNGIPRLPKALSSTMPTFDGKSEKFELFEDLFNTSLKVYPQITEAEKINYFHSLMRGEALQTFRNMTVDTKNNLDDILLVFRRRYVKPQSVATARCKWDQLHFDPSTQSFQDFLEHYQKLAREAHGDDASKFIQSSFYAKMPPHLKRALNQARLENESYEDMVAHLEREMELNGLASPEDQPIALLNQVGHKEEAPRTHNKECHHCGRLGHYKKDCRRLKYEQRNTQNRVPNKITPNCQTCGKRGHETRNCYAGANWENRPSWWKGPQPQQPPPTTYPNNTPLLPNKQPTDTNRAQDPTQTTEPQTHHDNHAGKKGQFQKN